MKKPVILTLLLAVCFSLMASEVAYGQKSKYKTVIEESFYLVDEKDKDEFLRIYRSRLFPFWQKMKDMGLIVDQYRMYSQRIHTIKPLWTYKTVVKFKNYAAIDKWLEVRDEVYNKMFPGEGGYKGPRKQIGLITKDHWDEFIREIPMK